MGLDINTKMKVKVSLGAAVVIGVTLMPAISFAKSSDWFKKEHYVCFSRQDDCEAKIVDLIDESERSIQVLSYVFTSNKIADALIEAKKRGVDVRIKAQGGETARYKNSKIKKMKGQGIPIELIDDEGIFHHKVMIFDEKIMETGSFNYTWSAQNKNHENILFLKDQEVIGEYLKNMVRS